MGGRVSRLFCALIRLYQRYISPMHPPVCRFYPSCSSYAIGAIEKYGAIKGVCLGVKRIARCGPWCKGGYDPVP